MVFHMLNPSRGLVPLVLPPANLTSVGSQSEMCMSSLLTVPGFSNNGLLTNPTPRMPPSHSVHFLPLRGQLLPPALVWPPLSVQQTPKNQSIRVSKDNTQTLARCGNTVQASYLFYAHVFYYTSIFTVLADKSYNDLWFGQICIKNFCNSQIRQDEPDFGRSLHAVTSLK